MSDVDPLYRQALQRLEALIAKARDAGVYEPTAMTLATADAEGRPSARVVLCRGIDPRGLVFYTNLESDKGNQLRANPRAALCFWWRELGWQVRVEGPAEQVADAEADAYWRTRPRESQVGAWASDQSRPLEGEEILTARVVAETDRFEGADVPRPPNWSGVRVVPEIIELWENRPARLHRRERYRRGPSGWTRERLFP